MAGNKEQLKQTIDERIDYKLAGLPKVTWNDVLKTIEPKEWFKIILYIIPIVGTFAVAVYIIYNANSALDKINSGIDRVSNKIDSETKRLDERIDAIQLNLPKPIDSASSKPQSQNAGNR
jgi:hypothetical protein